MGEDDPLSGAPPPEPLTQVHHHHAEDVAVAEHVAVAEPVDEAREKKDIKTVFSL